MKNKNNESSYLNRNFILLTQGNFVSAIGTVLYGIAIGFWIMSKTNSATLTSIASATVVIPGLFFGPIAGVIIDRIDKKVVLVWTDMIAGVTILFVTILAFIGRLQIWQAMIAGLIVGITEVFAIPAARAALPALVPAESLSKANAAYSAAFTTSSVTGRSLGGILYQIIGGPYLFLLNGISYIYCAISEMFVCNMPVNKTNKKSKSMKNDFIEGAKLLNSIDGLMQVFIIIAFLNFFGIAVFTLYLPFFYRTPGLEPIGYGIVMACSTSGALLGQLFYSVVKIKEEYFPYIFSLSGLVSNLLIIIFPLFNNVYILSIIIFLSGLTASGINIVLNTSLQKSIPKEYHGRIFSFVGMIGGALIPLGMIIAGTLADIFDVKYLISFCGVVISLLFFISSCNNSVKSFLLSQNIEKHPTIASS